MLNLVIESGYLSKYINTGTSGNGRAWVNFSLYQKVGRDGKQYVPVSAFDSDKSDIASNFVKWAKAGDLIEVQGHLNVKKTDNRTEISLIADSIRAVVTPAPKDYAPPQAQKRATEPTQQYSGIHIDESDLPF